MKRIKRDKGWNEARHLSSLEPMFKVRLRDRTLSKEQSSQ